MSRPDPRFPRSRIGPLDESRRDRVVARTDHSLHVDDTDDGSKNNWYYVRVVQSNQEYARSSPIWVEKA